jgi:magnesium-transporting ATPase (P-type)
MKFTTENLENIYKELRTDPNAGLTEAQALEIQKEKGLNKFDEEKKETVLMKIVHHMRDFTTIILFAAAVIAFCSAAFSPGDGGKSYTDAFVIFAIVVLNVTLAVRQEMGAEKALEALKRMNAQTTLVIRGGAKREINAEELVPGDIIVLEAGDMIPADARIIESINLKSEEALLTGESVPVEKDAQAEIAENAPLGDQFNMLFSGCLVTNGNAKAVVVDTGMTTEMGKIMKPSGFVRLYRKRWTTYAKLFASSR